MHKIIIKNISVPAATGENAAIEKATELLSRYADKKDIVSLTLYKKSVDARKKDDIKFVCSVAAIMSFRLPEKSLEALGAAEVRNSKLDITFGSEHLSDRPVIVGSGPCGMFCALLLAENGYRPIMIERGGSVDERAQAVERFYKSGILDSDSNIQFGAGGAGTFSDGKLLTRINDPLCEYVLERFSDFGAPENILTLAKPHIGTDKLRSVVAQIHERIATLGGSVFYNTKFEDASLSNGRAVSIQTDKGVMPCGALVLAIGHSARDTYDRLLEGGFSIVPKDFSAGVRIEHLQEDIDAAMYGKDADIDILGHAEYTLSLRNGQRGVYTFCMCPGGEVVAASSEEGGVVTNGMSCFARDGRNANSAIAVSVLKEDYGASVRGAINFQRLLERAAFKAGNGNYNAPVQCVGDFLSGCSGSEPTRVSSTYMGGGRYSLCDLGAMLPHYVTEMLKLGIADFDKKIKGFASPSALFTGFETRTSSPVRILREDDLTAVGFENIYPAGEGAGYAGGITSSAVDGLRCALAIMKKYRNN